MVKGFPRGKPGDNPTEGNVDELLTEIPQGGTPGSIAAYRSGSRVRRWVFGLLIVGTIGAAVAGHQYFKWLERQRVIVRPEYVVDEEASADAVRAFHWDDGSARLGLSREPPGVEVIVLPDREIRLADGHDHAQVNLTVRDGKTIKLKVLSGKIVQTPTGQPRPEAAASSP
jgi:hypothetical protein